MKFFKNKLNRKGVISTIATAFLLFLGSAQFTHADGLLGVGSLESSVIGTVAEGVSYVLAVIFGVLISIESWFIGIVLNINATVLQTTLVQTGFSISLAVANLAFVLGIIVIAIATILRNQTYGIKQLLWKLVVMAILVNFGLVIMSPIFALGNSFTQYFLNCINPGAGGCTQSASGLSSFNAFGETMAGAFNPPKSLVASDAMTAGSSTALNNPWIAGSLSVTAGSSISTAIVPIISIVFVVINLFLIVVVLGGFLALLTVRYLYIAILAILLPFAWASWVFPSFSSHWKKWWELFIRWTFFAPMVLFFVYLALLTMKGTGNSFDLTQYTQNNGIWSALSNFLSAYFSPIITAFLQEILLGGLIVGGMIAANAMGIKLAGTMVKAGEKGGKAIRGAAWNATKKRTSERLGSMGRKTINGETTTTAQRVGSRMQGVPLPFAKSLGSKIAAVGAPATFHEKNKEEIKKYNTSELKGLDNKGLLDRANGKTAFVNLTGAAAIAQELAKRDLTKSIDSARMKQFLDVSEKMGNVQSILNNRPELAAQTSAAEPKTIIDPITGISRLETVLEAETRAISEATKKIKVPDVTDLNHKSLGDHTGSRASIPYDPDDQRQTIALSMSPQQLRKLVTEGSSEQTRAFKDTIDKMMIAATTPGTTPLPPAIDAQLNKLHDYITGSPEWRGV